MKKIRNGVVAAITAVLIFCVPVLVSAQTNPGCDDLCNCRSDNSICPIDNSVWILLIIGALYGIKKIRDARRKQLPAS